MRIILETNSHMNVHLHNVNLNSSYGQNSFGQKLIKYMSELGVEFDRRGSADANLCFISSPRDYSRLFQRLDGIYFNTDFDYDSQNTPILNTYKNAYGAIYQSNFNKRLVTSFFGKHSHSVVIHNGADLDTISNVQPAEISCEGDVWCCCSSWRPHKRLDENVRYFLEHSSSGDLLVVAGNTDNKVEINPHVCQEVNSTLTLDITSSTATTIEDTLVTGTSQSVIIAYSLKRDTIPSVLMGHIFMCSTAISYTENSGTAAIKSGGGTPYLDSGEVVFTMVDEKLHVENKGTNDYTLYLHITRLG